MRAYNDQIKNRLRESLAKKNNSREKRVQESIENVSLRRTGEPKEIIVIGAGAAGLCATYELEKQGHKVTILEAQKDHIGGRIRTLRSGNLYGELGAMRIPESHNLTLKYVNDFNLQTRDFVQDNPDTFAHIRNKTVKRNDAGYDELKPLFKELDISEQDLSVHDIWKRSVIATLESLSDQEEVELYDHINSGFLKRLDQRSLYNELRSKNFSRDAIEYVCSVYGVTTYLDTGLTEHLREEHDGVWIGKFKELVGGMDHLVKGFQDRISAEIKSGAIVEEIINDELRPKVNFRYNNGVETLECDWLICTIPLGVLSRLELDRAFSSEKINAIRNIHYDSSSKIVCETKDRFWESKDGIYGGGSIWDGGLGHTWYPSDNKDLKDPNVSNSNSFLLASYTWGMHARRIDSIPEDEIHSYVYDELIKIHPHMKKDQLLSSKRWSWDNHEWSSGAFSFFNPGDHSDMYAKLVKPENRVLLAGEHCSLTHSWIQGSLESALEVCQHILDQ